MGILDFPPSNLDGSSTVRQFSIGTRLVVNLTWLPGATASGVFFSLEYCTGSACSGFTEFTTDLVFPYVDGITGIAHFLDGYDRTLTPSTIYRYRIRNQYAGGYSTYSNIFEITLPAFTPDPVPDPGTDTSIPLPPSNFAAGGTGTTIDLTWTDNSTNESGFIIERYIVDPNQSQTTFNWQIRTVPAADAVSFSDTGLIPQTTYYYRIKSYNQYGESAYATSVSKTTDAVAVTNLQIPTLNSAVVEQQFLEPPKVVLTWTDNSSTETAFLIERRVGVAGPFSQIFVAAANAVSYTDVNVVEGGMYSYRLRAYRSSDTAYSGYSSVKSVTVGEPSQDGTIDGKARFFNAALSSRLDTGVTQIKGSTNNTSGFAWIKKPTEDGSTIFGFIDAGDINSRLDFFCELGSVGGIFTLRPYLAAVNGNVDVRACKFVVPVDLRDVPIFVAFVNDTPNNRCRFFWGMTADTIIEAVAANFVTEFSLDTAIAFQNSTNPTCTLTIGALGREGNGAQNYFTGVIDAVGLEYDSVLSLNDLKNRARCGSGAGLTANQRFWPITGEDPEPGIVTIYDTTVVDELCTPRVTGGTQIAGGYAIAHVDQDGDANIPSTGGVIRDNQMKNNGSGIMSANIYLLQDVTIDNPGAQNTYIRRGVVLME